MAKIRNASDEKMKINANRAREDTAVEYPSFSFLHLTHSKKRTYEFFGKNKGEMKAMSHNLHLYLITASKKSWQQWFIEGHKTAGLETVSKSSFEDDCIRGDAPDDLLVARFGPDNKYRMIGYKSKSIFFITAFDFDFSAYDHG